VVNHSTNAKRALLTVSIIIPSLVALGGVFTLPSRAQQPTTAAQEQRPRRVGGPASGASAAPLPPSSGGEEVDEGEVVRVDTQLVSVPVVVANREGRPLTGLRADNFTVFEDNRLQRIANFATTEAPFEVALLLDTSGSTREEVALIRRAASAFVDSLRPGDRVAIIAFNTAQNGAARLATVEVKTRLTSDRAALRKAIESIGASNGTPYYDALNRIVADVFNEPPREEVRGRRALVALTDGVDSTSDSDFTEARDKLLKAGVLCYFVQVNTEDFVEDRLIKDCSDDGRLSLSRTQLKRYHKIFAPQTDASDYSDFCRLGPFEKMEISRALYNLARKEMNTLAQDTGGKTFPVTDLQDARAAFAQVAGEIGTQYSLGYYPTNKARDGRFRTIRVEVHGVGSAQVRAREGYQAPKG